jgi:hypothetical protein
MRLNVFNIYVNKIENVVKDKNNLIYDLIFSNDYSFNINLGDYVDDIYQYDELVESIKYILKKSGVIIVKSTIKVDSKTAYWELKVKK